MQTVLEKEVLNPREIFKKLGVKGKENVIVYLEAMFEDKRLQFSLKDKAFTYFLITPISLEDGTTIDSLKVNEISGDEMEKIPSYGENPVGMTLESLSIINGIPRTIVGRIKNRDVTNLMLLLGVFI